MATLETNIKAAITVLANAIKAVSGGGSGLKVTELPTLTGANVATADRFLILDASNGTIDPVAGSLSQMAPAELLAYLRRNGLPYAKNTGASTVTNSSGTTPTDLTNLSWSIESGRTYHLKMQGTFQTAATTTGIGFLLVPTTATLSNARAHIKIRQAAAGTDSYYEDNGPPGTIMVNASVIAAATDYDFEYEAWFTAATANGSVKAQVRSEVNASQVTVQPGAIAMLVDCTG